MSWRAFNFVNSTNGTTGRDESPLLRSRSPHQRSGRLSPSPISSPRTASVASTPLASGGSGAIPFSNHLKQSVYFQEFLGSMRKSSNGDITLIPNSSKSYKLARATVPLLWSRVQDPAQHQAQQVQRKFTKFTMYMKSMNKDQNLTICCLGSPGPVFAKGVDAETVVFMTARASRLENQDAIDTAIVVTLADPKEAHAGVQEVHFLPLNPTNKQTSVTYTDQEVEMFRVSKGAPEQTPNLAHNETDEVEL
ncbi:hypothetical protein KIW84_044623 [Lathyrus oleraceus]|uniref:Uncharacterized protein n=1 Tax=Pisum sativum TaxID=3888 RepID=A0A9D4XI98_PEA|nr:hypothetical protein KIW84_044623 [Pisum sativum]